MPRSSKLFNTKRSKERFCLAYIGDCDAFTLVGVEYLEAIELI